MEYQAEFEINTNDKVLFEFLSTAGGLQQWMAEDVKVLDSDAFEFLMDGEAYKVKLVSSKPFKYVKFEFFELEMEEGVVPFLEFKLEVNDITQEKYLVVNDASTLVDSQEECYEIWGSMIAELKDIIGA